MQPLVTWLAAGRPPTWQDWYDAWTSEVSYTHENEVAPAETSDLRVPETEPPEEVEPVHVAPEEKAAAVPGA